MKKILVKIYFSFFPVLTLCQVGIGTSTPSEGSILDVISNNKGVLIPRLQLTGTNDLTTVPVSLSDAGLMVYNLEDLGISPYNVFKDTFYLWNGTSWEDVSNLDYARQVIQDNNVSTTLFVGRPAAAVTANASASYTAWTTVDFGNESLDADNIHNNGIFTIPETGLYSFGGGINLQRSDGSGASKYFGGRIILNGTEVATSMFGTTPGGNAGYIPLYWNAMLNMGDTVQIQYRMRDNSSSGTFTLSVQTNMSVIKNSN